MKKLFLLICFLSMLAACNITSVDIPASTTAKENIAKAAIAVAFFKSPHIMTAKPISGGLIYVSYTRNDGKFWDYECRIKANTVIWRAPDGRWRYETPIQYKINSDNTITVKEEYSDGSTSSEKTYTF